MMFLLELIAYASAHTALPLEEYVIKKASTILGDEEYGRRNWSTRPWARDNT